HVAWHKVNDTLNHLGPNTSTPRGGDGHVAWHKVTDTLNHLGPSTSTPRGGDGHVAWHKVNDTLNHLGQTPARPGGGDGHVALVSDSLFNILDSGVERVGRVSETERLHGREGRKVRATWP